MRAIDLYAGVGGWAVGLKMAGIDLVCSYEWWAPAANTHHANSSSPVKIQDIRKLQMCELPDNIDLVVGSPPCTQFSYSNRGGSGDLADGLQDIKCFLDVVRYTKPKQWAFENVPRVKKVLEKELSEEGALNEYVDLFIDAKVEVLDMADFGVPQRRKRCIAGNIDFELLRSYAEQIPDKTLGEVVTGLSQGADPIYISPAELKIWDNDREAILSKEEERFNREMKVAHPVYNGMPFPDPLERTSRTVTATCTRVSRESLVVLDDIAKGYRRLSVRERASLQSFPATFQFLGKSHSEKLKMVGNAIPPAFAYLIAEAAKSTSADQLILPAKVDANSLLAAAEPTKTKPDNPGRSYPSNRRFRFAIPNLRFKSGTRFELANVDGPDNWSVGFYFGNSKQIERRNFQKPAVLQAAATYSTELFDNCSELLEETVRRMGFLQLSELQATWSHRLSGTHPFEVVDELGSISLEAMESASWKKINHEELCDFVFAQLYSNTQDINLARHKITSLAPQIAVGIAVAGASNHVLSLSHNHQLAAE